MLMNSLLARSASWVCAIRRALRNSRAPRVESCCSDWTATGSKGSSRWRPRASKPIVSPPMASGATRKRRNGWTMVSRPSGAPIYSLAESWTALPFLASASTFGMRAQRVPTPSPLVVDSSTIVDPSSRATEPPSAPTDSTARRSRRPSTWSRCTWPATSSAASTAAFNPAAEGRFQRLDGLFDQRLAGEVVERVALADPGQGAGPAVGRLDDHVLVDQAGQGGAVGVEGVQPPFQDAGDHLPRLERADDVEGDLDKFAEVAVRIRRPRRPGYRHGSPLNQDGTIQPPRLPQVARGCVTSRTLAGNLIRSVPR